MRTKTLFCMLFICLVLCHGSLDSHAQKPAYYFQFEGIGDNREYFSPYHQAETILGSRVTLAAQFTTNQVHSVRAGFSYFYEFGSSLFEQEVKPVLYYQYSAQKFRFNLGAFPRTESIAFPLAFISDRYTYFEPNIDGLALRYRNERGEFGLMTDWVSRQDSTRREQFWTGFHGKQKFGMFGLEAYGYLFHNAHRLNRQPGDFIEDNMGSLVLVGLDLSAETFFDVLILKGGVLSTAFRNRGNGSDFTIGHSSYGSLDIAYRKLGAELIMKFGSQHHLAFGDDFFNTAKNYSSLKLFADFFSGDKVKGTFAWTFHLANGDLDQQQQVKLLYYFERQ